MLIVDPILEMPYIEELLPRRARLLIDMELPIWTKSKTEREDPNLPTPNTEIELPRRAKLLKLIADPMWKKSKIETELPRRI